MQQYVPEDKLVHLKRVLYGSNQGLPVQPLDVDSQAVFAAQQQDFDLKAFAFKAAPEQMRPPRVVRIGLLQNKVVLPTTAPYLEQARVMHEGKWRASIK